MMSRLAAGRLLVGLGIIGLLASLGGILIGRSLLAEADLAMQRSLALTGESLEALEASIQVAEETVVLIEGGLEQAEVTTRALVGTVEEGSVLLEATAELTEDRVAGGLEAVDDALPSLIQVAAVIDRTLSALSSVPFGPSYNPDEPFDQSIREIQRSIAGVPEDLREQAVLIRAAGENLGEVAIGTEAIADDLSAIRTGMAGAVDVLGDYTVTAAGASELIADTRDGLGDQVRLARWLITLLGLVIAAGQIIPLALGWSLLRPAGERPLLREDVVRTTMTSTIAPEEVDPQ
jgi:hypothetical protein